jgi:hypothetical protein
MVAPPLEDGERVFCDGLEEDTSGQTHNEQATSSLSIGAAAIRRDLVGRLAPFTTPYGSTPLVYADWTATGRPLASIEAYISDAVLPMLGNTHTTTSVTGSQSTCFHKEVLLQIRCVLQCPGALNMLQRADEQI